jgi:hypothetical protein
MTRYFSGLDLGQSQDYTAFAILERTRLPNPSMPGQELNHYAVRHLQRFALGTPYNEVGSALQKAYAHPDLQRSCLVVDQTAVGSPVIQALRRCKIQAQIRPLTVSAGYSTTFANGTSLVPKKVLVSTLQVLFQARQLQVAPTLTEAATLVQELVNFKWKTKLVADDTLTEWREGDHDDLVLAVAIAAWEGERYREFEML